MNDFSKPKIVWGNLCLSAQFAYVDDEIYINAPSPMIVPGSKYLLAVLNSKLADWYIRQLGVTRNGGYFEYKPMFIEKLPVPFVDDELNNRLSKYVDAVMANKQSGTDTSTIENEIDNIIYSLYDLNLEEIAFIKNQ